jgi:PAS domain S-box-containing protein
VDQPNPAVPAIVPPDPAIARRAKLRGEAGLTAPAFDRPSIAMHLFDDLAKDMVYRYRLGHKPGFEYVNRASVALTGYTPAEHYAAPDLGIRLVHPEDRHLFQAVLQGHSELSPVFLRWVRRDSTVVWTEHRATLLRDEHGKPAFLDGIVRDVTDMVLAGEAVRATQAYVRGLLDGSTALGVILDPGGRILHANRTLLDLSGWTLDELRGRIWSGFLGDPAEPNPAAVEAPVASGSSEGPTPSTLLLRDGSRHLVQWSAMAVVDSRGVTVATAALGDDVTEDHATSSWLAHLTAAVGLSGESVIITDREGRILFVNAAFERITGYRSEEVIGKNPSLLSSGHQTPAFYRAMWWILGRGRTWRGEMVNRRKDGALLIEEAAISPVKGTDGTLAGYVAVQRDVTRQHKLRASLDDANQQREVLAAALHRLGPRDSAEETCNDLAAVLCELPSVIAAGVAVYDGGPVTQLVGFRTTTPLDLSAGIELPDFTARMVDHAEQGPWIEPLDGLRDRPEVRAARDAGIGALLIVPIRHEGLVLGALVIAGSEAKGADLEPLVPTAAQVASVARSLLAPHVAGRLARERARERARRIIADHAFRTVFQPIVDLFSGGIVGFEALTRFDNRSGPEAEFAAAAGCGMGEAFELATLEAAAAASVELPAGAVLFLNVSPTVLVTSATLPRVVRGIGRQVVIEVTEREQIPDYAAVWAAIGRMGPGTRVAVDDAGAGAANLRHLVSLRPDFVKLDFTLVHGIDEDLTRQAMVLGLLEFARVSGRSVIAEGIETELERTTLAELSVRFGQGYLLGAPAPAESWSHVVIEDPESFAADSGAPAWSRARGPRDGRS